MLTVQHHETPSAAAPASAPLGFLIRLPTAAPASVTPSVAGLAHSKPLLAPVPHSSAPTPPQAPPVNYSSDNNSSDADDCSSPSSRFGGDKRDSKRSTKSKCPPGLRSGKWTPEEEAFTNKMIHFFRLGLLDIEDGTSLRWYLSKKLNCEAMRVTKKLKGNSSIGKQIFRALESTAETAKSIQKAAMELQVLEDEFFTSLAIKPAIAPKTPIPSSGRQRGSSSADTKSSAHHRTSRSVPDHSDEAELLLHFCLTAHRGEKRKRVDESVVFLVDSFQ
ncbi:hypothetical protein H310_02576 [Aphanomyces invadans]|uniref:Uncharacterized protein n=1 Tax=Aphanomyces invadans TaxID=157072 RepID=A0A024UKY5_9STRA|nr:hypothetical protein H310_02576 [Aphanomyces invadans]ETW06283.1 hypothetical protein H310_02576 [Aphanomyces invadans]RHY28429.1 hypothetical protein DYB32_005983 [Aphanomyces invadans]|eukprot:XP_008864358.1 hypothetical protein H310_02576 [Aphanomyces invadans]